MTPSNARISRSIGAQLQSLASVLYGTEGYPPSLGIGAIDYDEGIGQYMCAAVTATQPPTQRAFDELHHLGRIVNNAFEHHYVSPRGGCPRARAIVAWYHSRVRGLDDKIVCVQADVNLTEKTLRTALKEADAAIVSALNARDYARFSSPEED